MGKLANIPGADLVPKINSAHRQACDHASKAIEYAAECGRLLLKAKEVVPHGEWLPWLNEHTEVGERQSQKYTRLAQNWDGIKNELGNSYLGGIDGALKLIAKPKAKSEEPKDGYRAFFRDDFKMKWWDVRPTRDEAVKDLEDFFADEWIESADGTRRRRPMSRGFYCVATEERFQAIAHPEGSWCSVGPTTDEIFRIYDGPGEPEPVTEDAVAAMQCGISVGKYKKILAEIEGNYPLEPEPVAGDEVSMPLGDSIEEARAYYAVRVADLGDDERADELKEFKFLMARLLTAKKKQASTLPADGRSEGAVDDPTPENEGDDLGEIPAGFDRRRSA